MTFFVRLRRVVLGSGIALLLAFAVAPAIAADVDVHIDKLAFLPGEVTVQAGDSVVWTVTNAVPEGHSVTSGEPGAADSGAIFDSGIGLKENGQSFTFTFEEPGNFDYYCVIHGASMSGQVIVTEAGASPAESPAASAPVESAAATAVPVESPAASPGASPAASPGESPGAAEPPHELHDPIPPDRKLLAAGILGATLVILFGAAAVWRRMNPA